jgi:hypothetical protein
MSKRSMDDHRCGGKLNAPASSTSAYRTEFPK